MALAKALGELVANGNGNGSSQRSRWAVLTTVTFALSGTVGGGVGAVMSYLQNEVARASAAELEAELRGEINKLEVELRADAEVARKALASGAYERMGEIDASLRRDLSHAERDIANVQGILNTMSTNASRLEMEAGLQRQLAGIERRLERLETHVYGRSIPGIP